MVLRYLYIQHENKKRQQEVDDRELAPYQDYLDKTIERGLAQERAIIAPKRVRGRQPQISLAEALVKLPLKLLQELDNRLWVARREKRRKDQFRRQFLHWLRTTKPHFETHDPQEHVRRFYEIHKTPFLKAYEEAYKQGFEEGRRRQAAMGDNQNADMGDEKR